MIEQKFPSLMILKAIKTPHNNVNKRHIHTEIFLFCYICIIIIRI